MPGSVGCGTAGSEPVIDALPFFSLPPSTLTNLYQNPLTQE
jgi:hypothetical protein